MTFRLPLLALTALLGTTALAAEPAPAGDTLANLQAAFNGESNASAKYALFAEKADADGYGKAAALFRAASRAEALHAATHARVIQGLGAEPKAEIHTPEPGDIAANLQTALEGETYEHEQMYPKFIELAQAEGNASAVQTFTFAMKAEIGHAALYGAALADLDGMKGEATMYICPICGLTEDAPHEGACPVCFTPGEQFLSVQ